MAARTAQSPDDLFRLFVERANARDLDGLMELYEPGIVMLLGDGGPLSGQDAVRSALEGMLAQGSTLSADGQRPSTVAGDLALTSAEFAPGMVTAEVARRQPDGTWKWVIDVPGFVAPQG